MLRRFDQELRDQNAYRGLDSYSEIQLHPLLYQAFADSEHGAHREVGYPTSARSRPIDTQRQRCDLVLTPRAGQALFDPIDEQRGVDRAVGTLFAAHAAARTPDEDEALPEDAFWIEVKCIAQSSYVDGVPGPNPKYTRDLLVGPKLDVIKLASDPRIHHGGSLIVLFSEEERTGTHDIAASISAMIEQDLPISVPEFESFPIVDLAGNQWCTLGLIPIRL